MSVLNNFDWVISPGLREVPKELQSSGLRFTIVHNFPPRLEYRNGSLQLVTLTLATAEWAWVAIVGKGREGRALVIFRVRSMSMIWEKHQNGFQPESLPAEKIVLRLVREGFGRVI